MLACQDVVDFLRPSMFVDFVLYNLLWSCCRLSICCGLVVQLVVQHVVQQAVQQQVRNKLKQLKFGPNR